MFNRNEVVTIVHDAIIETFGLEEVVWNENLSLKDDLKADSLDMMSLAMILEEEFDAEIETEQVVNFITVNNIVDYVMDRQKQEAA